VEHVEHFFSLYGPVEILEVDDDFKRHMRQRGRSITVTDIATVHSRPDTEYFDNDAFDEDSERSPIVMLGYASESRFLTIPLDPTGLRGVWRARTAYLNDRDDERKYWDWKHGGV